MVHRSIVYYLLRLLLSKLGPKKLRSLLWTKRDLVVETKYAHDEYSYMSLHPRTALFYGILPNQLVKVTFQVTGETRRLFSRYLLLLVDPSLSPSSSLLSVHDLFNAFNTKSIDEIRVKTISPPSLVPPLPSSDSIRVCRVIQPSHSSIDADSSLQSFFSRLRVVYNGDVVVVEVKDACQSTKKRIPYKLDLPSDCLLISPSVSLYEVSPVHSLCPLGSLSPSSSPFPLPPNSSLPLPPFSLPPNLHKLCSSISSLCLAQSKMKSSVPLSLLLFGSSGSGKRLIISRIASSTHRNWMEINCLDIWSEVSSQAEQKFVNAVNRGTANYPCILYLSHVDALGYDTHSRGIDSRVLSSLRSFLNDVSLSSRVVFILGCDSRQLSQVSPSIRESVLSEFSIPLLTLEDRLSLLSPILSSSLRLPFAKSTAGFVVSELVDTISDAHFIAFESGRGQLILEDLEKAIEKRNENVASSIATAKVPSVSWDDIGGLEDTKRIVRESLDGCLKGGRMKRTGILLYGPPGCGKTLLAKAVATEYKVAFVSVKGPELLNKYVGQSEENLRNVFERARQASPCVIFFDELDSIAPNRGRHGDSGGVMDRIVSQLLSELDSLQTDSTAQVFVMGATNRVDLLDQALLSPGRFDKIVDVSPGKDVESRMKVLQAVARSVQLGEDVDMRELASLCPEGMTGAELYSIVANATMSSIREQVDLLERKEVTEKDADMRVYQRHLLDSISTGRHLMG